MKNILVDRIELNQSLDACIQGVVGPARDALTFRLLSVSTTKEKECLRTNA